MREIDVDCAMMSVFIIILKNKEAALVKNGPRAFTFIYIAVWVLLRAQDLLFILIQSIETAFEDTNGRTEEYETCPFDILLRLPMVFE